MNNIPLVFSTDENYIFPTAVVISSALQHAKKDTYYTIFIQTLEACKNKCEEIFGCLYSRYNNFEIHYIFMDIGMFQENMTRNPHVTIPTYYRLLTAELLLEYDKCICLDSDILILDDLYELYSFDMNNSYIAGVKSWEDQQETEKNRQHMNEIGLASMDDYIYLGVLLMNLKQIREDNITEQFIEHMSKEYRSDDQDVFNICCYGNIAFLPLKYNLLIRHYKENYPEGKMIYTEKEINDSWSNPVILHYPGRMIKPWKNSKVKKSMDWWEAAQIFNCTDEYKNYKKSIEDNTNSLYWEYIEANIPSKSNIAVFGYTDIGKKIADKILEEQRFEVVGFCDNDSRKQGENYKDIVVYSVNDIMKNYSKENMYFVISSQLYAEKIKSQLLELKVDKEKIFIYYEKDWTYYASVE